jgi:hypothetical protein
VEDYHPELAEYEPYERRARSRTRVNVLRGVVILAVVALVLPGVLTTWSFSENTARGACDYWAGLEVATQHRAEARFEAFGPGFMSWECYAVTAAGEQHVRTLGPIPVAPAMTSSTVPS